METSEFLLQLLLILVVARAFAELATRGGVPAVLGELSAGLVLGPSVLGWVEAGGPVHFLAEVGIILMLFEVGLETDVGRLVRTGGRALIVATVGFLLPLGLGFLGAYFFFRYSALVSLFVGGTLTATSIAITVRVLSDLKRTSAPEGQIVLGAAVLDDVLGVILLALLYDFSVTQTVSLVAAGRVALFVGVFFLVAPFAAKAFSVVIQRLQGVSKTPGLIPTTIVSLVLGFAWLAHSVGAPELLGGFAAGLALSRRFFLPLGVLLHTDERFSQEIEAEMRPIVHLFTPIFFVYVGLNLDLGIVRWGSPAFWAFGSALFLAAVAGKLMAGALLIKERWAIRGIIGLAMMPRGEVGLIFAELGYETQVFDDQIYAALVMVIALTTLLPPFLMKWMYSSWLKVLPASDDHRPDA